MRDHGGGNPFVPDIPGTVDRNVYGKGRYSGKRSKGSSDFMYGICCIFRVCYGDRSTGGIGKGDFIPVDLPASLCALYHPVCLFVEPRAGGRGSMACILGYRTADLGLCLHLLQEAVYLMEQVVVFRCMVVKSVYTGVDKSI